MTGTGPASQHTVRRHNSALVLAAVTESPGISRAGIAARTGLTKATVSTLVDRLLAASLLHDAGPQRREGRGRPGAPLSVSPAGPHGLGVEIAVDYVATCLVDLTGDVRHLVIRHRDNRSQPIRRVFDAVARAVLAARRQAERLGVPVGGLEVAVPGLVESSTGLLRVAPNLGWRDVDVAAELRRRIDLGRLRVAVGNEANFAALAHLWVGPSRDFIHVSGEIGIGAGIVVDGELFTGTRGFGGELGHVPVQPRGPRCSCGGRGCLERLAGQEAILSRAGAPGWDALLERLDARDRAATTAVRAAAQALGTALSGVVSVLDVPTVVLGGAYARLYPWLSGPLRTTLRSRVMSSAWSPVDVVRSSLGTEAAVRGAATSAVRTILADPDPFIETFTSAAGT